MYSTSAHLAPPVLEHRVQSRPGSPGAQLPWRRGGEMGTFPLLNLPRDVLLSVLEELRPAGPVTAYESSAEKPMVSPGHLECRTSLLNICLASSALYELAIPCLYRHPLVTDKLGLYRFFCALAKQADRRPMVRSFAWAGVLWEDEPDAISSIRHLEDEAVSSAEVWNSIKDEWPREPVDFEIAKLSEYDAPDTNHTSCFAPEDFFVQGALCARSPSCQAYCTRIFLPVVSLCPRRHSQKFHQPHLRRSRTCTTYISNSWRLRIAHSFVFLEHR